jgi:hypothetical protein
MTKAIEAVLVGVGFLILLALLMLAVVRISTRGGLSLPSCAYSSSYECYVYRVEQCIATEWGTKEQCIQLVDGYFDD